MQGNTGLYVDQVMHICLHVLIKTIVLTNTTVHTCKYLMQPVNTLHILCILMYMCICIYFQFCMEAVTNKAQRTQKVTNLESDAQCMA